MVILKGLSVLLVSGAVLGTAQMPDDPVMRARAQRAQAQGIAEDDLPPLPKAIVEPPPLPPPEQHVKDSRKQARGKASKGKVAGKTSAKSDSKKKSSTRRKGGKKTKG